MQRRNTTLLLLAALLLLAGALPWWLQHGDGAVAPQPNANGGAAAVPPAPIDDGAQQPRPASDLPPDAPRVVVDVRLVEPYVPPPRVRAQAVLLPGREPLPTRLIAGTGAGAFAEAERAGVAMAAIELGGGALLLRQVAIEPNAVAEIPVGGRLVVRGTVTASGTPLAGARVSLGELDAAGNLREAATNADGRFELDTPAGDGAPLVVQAEGQASIWRPIRVAADAQLEQQVALAAGGALDVSLAAKAERLDLARLFLVPADAVSGELSQFPFFLQALAGGLPVGASGEANLRGLPLRGSAGIVVLHPGAPLPPLHAVKLEERSTLVQLAVGAVRAGRVVDANGAAVPGALLVLRPGGRNIRASGGLRFLSPDLDAAGCLLARTDAEGAFVLGEPGQEHGILSLRAAGHAGRDVPWDGLDLAQPLVLPAWTGGNLELRILPPRAGAKWASSLNLGGCEHLVHEKDQPCVVALPRAGRFDFVVTTFVGEQQKESRTFTGVHATGPVELQAPQLR